MNACCRRSLWISNLCGKVRASLSGILVCQIASSECHLSIRDVLQMKFLKALAFVHHTNSTSLTPFSIVFNAITDRNVQLLIV